MSVNDKSYDAAMEHRADGRRPSHCSVQPGDILHLGDEAYVVCGSVALGMPVREITFHLEPVHSESEHLREALRRIMSLGVTENEGYHIAYEALDALGEFTTTVSAPE